MGFPANASYQQPRFGQVSIPDRDLWVFRLETVHPDIAARLLIVFQSLIGIYGFSGIAIPLFTSTLKQMFQSLIGIYGFSGGCDRHWIHP